MTNCPFGSFPFYTVNKNSIEKSIPCWRTWTNATTFLDNMDSMFDKVAAFLKIFSIVVHGFYVKKHGFHVEKLAIHNGKECWEPFLQT